MFVCLDLSSLLVDQKWQIEHLQTTTNELQSRSREELAKSGPSKEASSSGPAENEREIDGLRTMMSRQLEEFNKMKENLMKDLQNRCLKVVELEIALDMSRDQYQSALRNANPKSHQKKMATLEKSLEQITTVHKQVSLFCFFVRSWKLFTQLIASFLLC